MTSLDPTKVELLIIDALMHEMNEVVTELFTKGSHHRNTSVLLTQNILYPNKLRRSPNAHYMVLLKNVIEVHQYGQANVSRRRDVSEKQLRKCHE